MDHLSSADGLAAMDFLAGGGAMADLIRSKDWTATPLGPIHTWPQSLRTTVSLCLASNFPINIIWGPEHTQIYNDGYRVVCGEGHPGTLGMDYSVCWASAWPAIGTPFARALAGETSYLENQRMFLQRNGFLEETFFTFSLSPIRDETGGIGGLFHPVTETTATMLGERRTRAVRDLTGRLSQARTTSEVFGLAVETLAAFAFDLPFLLFYELTEQGGPDDSRYRLAAYAGLAAGTSASPLVMEPATSNPWPLAEIVATQAAVRVSGLARLLDRRPCGPYEEPPDAAVALPIGLPGSELPAAIMLAGSSSRLPFDDAYRGFYELVAAAIAAGLASAQAYDAEKRRAEALSAIDRAKTAFFSNVSHEFRTPLTLMLGPVEDALADPAGLPGPQRERLEVAHRNALRLLKLVNSLLDFSRIEAGRAQASFGPTDLVGLTADLASNFRSACDRAGLELTVECPPLGAPVHVDRDMWEKIVLNLLSNAFKFTLEGGITVSLRRKGGVAELVVRDTGVGIPGGELPRLFERFHRIEGQRGRTHEGSGIGLALVEELVRLHGGTIDATSIEGQGTAFRVVVPLGTAHLPPDRIRGGGSLATTAMGASAYVEEAMRWLPECAGYSPEPTGVADVAPIEGRPRIVLADDNADMRGYVARILEQGGYQVQAVADGVDALAAMRSGPLPDLVLTDVMMPRLGGFELLRRLRADPAMDGLLVILLSARAGEEARVEGLAAGADDYLVKPFSARELRARIDGAIGLARHRREAAGRERDLRAEIAVERGRAALRESEQRLELAMKAGALGSWEIDLATQQLSASAICHEHFGLGMSDPAETPDHLRRRIHADDRERHRCAVSQAIEANSTLDSEVRVVRQDGSVGWVQVRGHAVYGATGAPMRMVGVSLDVTARKQAEERQKLLLDELNHRVKNTLATVQSITAQTERSARSPAAFTEDLKARVAALARAHDLLTQESWDGASLADVVHQTLALYASDEDGACRVAAAGPTVRLGPTAAVTLNMAFHELATNAAKYGALSIPGGRVRVDWAIDRAMVPPVIDILWSEACGPQVDRPQRRGFGSRLIERGLAAELGGEACIEFVPDGVRCRMRLPTSLKIAVAA